MNSQLAIQHTLTVEAYLEGEQRSEIRHEFVDGQVYAMVGASDRHALIVNAIAYALTPVARGKRCQLFANDMKVRLNIASQEIFYYPDLILSCAPDDRERYFRAKPCLIIEVLSETTERIDRREKFLAYQTLPSLQEYILVAQDTRRVEIYRRSNEWKPEVHEQGEMRLECLEAVLLVDDVYLDVE